MAEVKPSKKDCRFIKMCSITFGVRNTDQIQKSVFFVFFVCPIHTETKREQGHKVPIRLHSQSIIYNISLDKNTTLVLHLFYNIIYSHYFDRPFLEIKPKFILFIELQSGYFCFSNLRKMNGIKQSAIINGNYIRSSHFHE